MTTTDQPSGQPSDDAQVRASEDSVEQARARIAELTAGKDESEILTMMRNGTLDTGDVLSVLIADGHIVIPEPDPNARVYTSEEIRAEFGID